MTGRYPIEYDVIPRQVEPGRRWLTASLQNIGDETLAGLDVRLNSLDGYSVRVYGMGAYAAQIEAGEQKNFPFQILAHTTARLYLSVDGWRGARPFHWETPGLLIEVGRDVAELVSLFVLNKPYAKLKDRIRCEATIRGVRDSHGLNLQFWADTPLGDLEELAIIDTESMEAGELVRYIAEFMPREVGLYTIYGYLFDGAHRIGREMEHVYVDEL